MFLNIARLVVLLLITFEIGSEALPEGQFSKSRTYLSKRGRGKVKVDDPDYLPPKKARKTSSTSGKKRSQSPDSSTPASKHVGHPNPPGSAPQVTKGRRPAPEAFGSPIPAQHAHGVISLANLAKEYESRARSGSGGATDEPHRTSPVFRLGAGPSIRGQDHGTPTLNPSSSRVPPKRLGASGNVQRSKAGDKPSMGSMRSSPPPVHQGGEKTVLPMPEAPQDRKLLGPSFPSNPAKTAPSVGSWADLEKVLEQRKLEDLRSARNPNFWPNAPP